MAKNFEQTYYDRQGNPLEIHEWMRLFTDWEYKRVLRTQIGKCDISTVWMGLNLNPDPDSAPFIFETMIFDGLYDGRMWRYTTEEEAIKMHNKIVQCVAEGTIPPESNVDNTQEAMLYKSDAYKMFIDPDGPEVA